MLAIILLVLGVISRLVVHIPNFTPVIAIALFSGLYLKRSQSIILPLVLLAITDIIIGFHQTMPFVWGGMILCVLIGQKLREKRNAKTIFTGSLISSIIFFLVSNLGVWLVGGLYPLTAKGFADCFIMAVPFFKMELLSTLVYAFLMFGLYEAIAARVQNTRFSHVL